MDKRIVLDIETAARIEREVRDNGRNIADNSLRLMTLTDKVDEILKMLADKKVGVM